MTTSDVRTNNQVKKEICFLTCGDIIRLEPGMRVYTHTPAMFKPYCAYFDTKPAFNEIVIGKVYKNVADVQILTDEIFNKIHSLLPVAKEQITNFINSLDFGDELKELDTSIYAGEYEVISGSLDGGSRCFEIDDGWHVFCQKIDDPSLKVDFYQSGWFSAMIEDIKPINR